MDAPVLDEVVPAPPGSLGPGTMVGEYRVEHKLGEGGMATVFAAIHPLIGKKAAIKVMSPLLSADANAVARFVLEARAVNRIGHPNIVDVFSFGRLSDGRSYFVMEWLQGETLYERLWHQHGPLPLPDVINILEQVCDALDAAHDKGIIHRDLKPANIFLTPVRGRQQAVKLLDFGIAKLAHQEMSPGWTSADCVVGTPEYISPEQARGKDVDARTDLYSLGVIAYEMVLGRLPFLSDNPADAIQMQLCAPPPRPSILWRDIPPSLESLLLRLLAKDPAQRATLAEVRQTLAALKPVATPALHRVQQAPPPVALRRRRHYVRLAAVAGAFVLLALLGYRPTHLRAQKLHTEAPIAPVAVAAPLPGRATTVVGQAPSTVTPAALAPAVGPNVHRGRKSHHDGNYLLDPFVR